MKKKIFHLSKHILQHELVKGSSYLFIGTFFASILAFFFNLFVVRKLTPSHYGEYASLISLFALAIIPASSLTTVIVRFATNYFSNGKLGKAKKLYHQLFFSLLGFCVVILLLSFFLSNIIGNFLHIHNTIFIFWVGLIVCISYISIVNTAYLQSILQFGYIAFITFLGALVKLIGGYIFLSFSSDLTSIFFAIFLSGVIAYIVSFPPLKFLLKEKSSDNSISLKEIILYAIPASITIIALSSLTSTDVILAKHFFDPIHAGIYAGISLVGKVIFYFTIPISSVMFPLVIKRSNKNENVISLLILSLLLVLTPAIGISIFYFLFPKFVIVLFLGGKAYLTAAPYVGIFGIYLSLFSAANILVSFFLSLNKMKVTYILSVGALGQIFFISLFHKDILQLLLISIIVLIVIIVALLVYYGKEYGKITKQKKDENLPYNPSL
jgi:O-antigen/teichoic acid export membrane protein